MFLTSSYSIDVRKSKCDFSKNFWEHVCYYDEIKQDW